VVTLVHLRVLVAVAKHGSVTDAAKELNYSQPSVSHHLARLEASTGAKLLQRVGRGIRLTPEGQLLARRATEIVGRVDAVAAELAAQVGLQAGRVRVAGFQSVLSTIVPMAAAALGREHPGIELSLLDAHPVEALRKLQAGQVDVALIFRHADTAAEEEGVRLVHVLDDPLYLISLQPEDSIANHRDSAWIGGCERCTADLVATCQATAGFIPRIAHHSDDMVVMQALVASAAGVTVLPGLALGAHRESGIHTTGLDRRRQIYAATYGDPPDPPAAAAFIEALKSVS
jgi:DNA-binding transcriptional LysR family regulator